MTNAEKYEQIFGFKPDVHNCPADECSNCPNNIAKCFGAVGWWNEEYKENTNGEI